MMYNQNTRRGFTQNNNVILNSIQDLQRLPLSLLNDMRGRFQIKFGMTTLCNNDAFTLIELLVVVLIIGILAAVAVPQYKYAVLKSQYMQAINAVEAIYQAEQIYFLANGEYTDSLEKLDVSVATNTPIYKCYLYPQDTICRLKSTQEALGYHVTFKGVRRCLIGMYHDPTNIKWFCERFTGRTGTKFGDSLSFPL